MTRTKLPTTEPYAEDEVSVASPDPALPVDISPIRAFLHTQTPAAWVEKALTELPTLLIDHARCEKKAAATAMRLMFRYPTYREMQHKLSRLAREELRHYEQVRELIDKRRITFQPLSDAPYAGALRKHMRKTEPGAFVDLMIIGAIIEARSCERFAAIAPHLDAIDPELAHYYRFLLKSEARHFRDYLNLARSVDRKGLDARTQEFLALEAELINRPEKTFRFHSGVPA